MIQNIWGFIARAFMLRLSFYCGQICNKVLVYIGVFAHFVLLL